MNRLLKSFKWLLLGFTFITALIIGIAIVIPLGEFTKEELNSISTLSQGGCGETMLVDLRNEGGVWHLIGENDEEIYCVQPGARVPYPHLYPRSKEEIIDLINKAKPGTGPSEHGCAPNVDYYLTKSRPYLRCVGEHMDTEEKGQYALAFIVSWIPENSSGGNLWSSEKQQAIWQTSISSGSSKEDAAGYEGGKELLKWANLYHSFYSQIKPAETGMKPKTLIPEEQIKVMADQDKEVYILGPFCLDYVKGRVDEEGIAFGGISNMVLKDDEGKELKIKNFIMADGEIRKVDYETRREQEEKVFFSNWDKGKGRYDPNCIDWYANDKAVPQPKEEFYIEVEYPGELVGSAKLHVDFLYLKCEAELCFRVGLQYFVDQEKKAPGDIPHTDYEYELDDDGQIIQSSIRRIDCHSCAGYKPKEEPGEDYNIQATMIVTSSSRSLESQEFELEFVPMTMKLGGNVFEDIPGGKESLADGIYAAPDRSLANIEVTLYEVGKGGGLTPAKLASLGEENVKNASATDYKRRINPTITDENGYYEFRGLDIMKQYVVKFRYNGQTYLPTEYSPGGMADSNGSNATELEADRNALTNRFASIGSSPENYSSTNSLGVGAKNKTYTNLELMGYKLSPEGVYQKTGTQLIDGYEYNADGTITNVYTEGLVSKMVKAYIDQNRSYPDLRSIYSQIAGGDIETLRKLQFIEDCKIDSYTKSHGAQAVGQFDTYPVYTKFTIYTNFKYPENTASDSYQDVTVPGLGTYKNIYPGQLKINLGLWRRPEADMALKKDVYKATLTINGKTQVYDYNEADVITDEEKAKLEQLENDYGRNSDEYLDYKIELENKYWDIHARVIDYATYYDSLQNNGTYNGYNRELYESDFLYQEENQLEAYVTYKITIRNQSQSILTRIDEVVDYYDETYEPQWDKSWVMYKNNNTDNNDAIRIRDQEFYDIMVGDRKVGDGKQYRAITSKQDNFDSKYSRNTQFELEGYDTLYVDGLKDKKLATGEQAYIYLTFKVKGKGSTLAIEEGTTDPGKQNIAEINGFSTFYADNTRLPNGVIKNSPDSAGNIDRDSNPGNFDQNALDNKAGYKYEHNFEDDTDRAKGIRLFIDINASKRIVSGTAWEDKRNVAVGDALVGNGIRENSEVKIKNILVELVQVELNENGEYKFDSNGDIILKKNDDGSIRIVNLYSYDASGNIKVTKASTVTNENGEYTFEGFAPGDYIVRFTYGGEYNAYYNGQDYKTTTYQTGIDQGKAGQNRTDVAKNEDPGYYGYTEYGAYDGNYGQNASGTYGYDIYKTDNNSSGNVSDAKDLWRLRSKVNNYSSNSYNGVTNGLATTLDNNDTPNTNTQMIAETGVVRVEFEYNRQDSTGDNSKDNNKYTGTNTAAGIQYENQNKVIDNYTGVNNGTQNNYNGIYHIKNVDLGLEERPKAGLEINKQVSHVKVTLANQTILFDTTQSVENLIWQQKTPYNINEMKEMTTKEVTNEDEVGPRVDTNGSKNVYSDYTKYDKFRNAVAARIGNLVIGQKGLIQATMDEEIMHGTTIEITYDMSVTNIGEVDYRETEFYYLGKPKNVNNIVRTSADVVMDYVANNLQFRENSNDNSWGWKTITEQQINTNNYVSNEVSTKLKEFNTIITTEALNKKLIPLTQSVKGTDKEKDTHDEIKLLLSQSITAQNESDDLSYGNIVEIVKISNDVGRRMAYSVQGNQDPTNPEQISEPDTSKAEQVIILPPFGEQYLYMGLGVFIATILGISIIVIKKTVFNTKKKF